MSLSGRLCLRICLELRDLLNHVGRPTISRAAKSQRLRETNQLPLFADPAQQLRDELAGVKIDELTPMQAFDLLRELKRKYKL